MSSPLPVIVTPAVQVHGLPVVGMITVSPSAEAVIVVLTSAWLHEAAVRVVPSAAQGTHSSKAAIARPDLIESFNVAPRRAATGICWRLCAYGSRFFRFPCIGRVPPHAGSYCK